MVIRRRAGQLHLAPALLTFALLIAPNATLGAWLWHSGRRFALAGFMLAVALIWISIAAIARNWRSFALWQLPLFLLSVGFAAYTLNFRGPPGYVFAAVLATSSATDYLGFFSIWAGQRLLLAGLILAGLYLWAARRVPATRISSNEPSALRSALLAAVGGLAVFAALHADALMDGLAADPLIGSMLFLGGPLLNTRAALHGGAAHELPHGVSRRGGEEVHILVLGESARRDSWSIYGYRRPTTPYLQSMQVQSARGQSIGGELVVLSNVVADANLTSQALPMMLTGMSPEEFGATPVHENIVDLANEAGYSTSWLSNQDVGIAALAGVAANNIHYADPLTPFFGGPGNVDGALLPALEAQVKHQGSRFIVIHTLGSHWEYYLRYPREFQRYGSSRDLSFISAFTSKPDQNVVDAYDNSVLYTDWLLRQVIESARSLSIPATVTYIADHGEDLYALDGSSGHGFATYTPHQFDIPAFIWVNAAYRVAHPEKIQALRANADQPIRSHDVFHSLADLMGIHWPGAKPHGSFASADFVPDTGGKVLAGGKLVDPRAAAQ
jgi:glucan phosphoethanolaminetransferase (alkaline phosphatase superfamily)